LARSTVLRTAEAGEFAANHVAFMVEPVEVFLVRPPGADHGDTDCSLGQGAVDLVAPLTHPDARHVAKDTLAPESDAQPIVEATARAAHHRVGS
jgi:hypothetical protein